MAIYSYYKLTLLPICKLLIATITSIVSQEQNNLRKIHVVIYRIRHKFFDESNVTYTCKSHPTSQTVGGRGQLLDASVKIGDKLLLFRQ